MVPWVVHQAPSPILNATLFGRLVCTGLWQKGVEGMGVWGKGTGGKHSIAKGHKVVREEVWLPGGFTVRKPLLNI